MLSAPSPVAATKVRYSAALERIGCFDSWFCIVVPAFSQFDAILCQQFFCLRLTLRSDLSGPGTSAVTNQPFLYQVLQEAEVIPFPAPADKGIAPQFFLFYCPESRRIMIFPGSQIHQHEG